MSSGFIIEPENFPVRKDNSRFNESYNIYEESAEALASTQLHTLKEISIS